MHSTWPQPSPLCLNSVKASANCGSAPAWSPRRNGDHPQAVQRLRDAIARTQAPEQRQAFGEQLDGGVVLAEVLRGLAQVVQ